jgi:hypothetical protein
MPHIHSEAKTLNRTSQTVIVNLAISLKNSNKDLNTSLYFDAGHNADYDPEE